MTLYPLLRLKPKEGRRARAGAPWVFSNEIEMTPALKALAPGSLVRVEGGDGRPFGTGYFNPASLIAARLLSPDPESRIDEAFFVERISHALSLRQAFFETPFYRLIHAEGDGLPGLVIDRFDDVLVLQITTAGMEALIAPLQRALESVIAPRVMILRNDTPARLLEKLDLYARPLKGSIPPHVVVEENGVRYFADLEGGQKTGWYFDQRFNRADVAALARGRSMLDVYCHGGGFSLLAAKRGAREAIGIDSSQSALSQAEEAATANGVSSNCKFIKADAFVELERLGTQGDVFDIVVADPPPFVKARKDLEAGARAYRRLARLAAVVTAPGGFLFLASCSHNISAERFAAECAAGIARTGRRAALVRQSGAGPDHPVHPLLPETAYLKALLYRLG